MNNEPKPSIIDQTGSGVVSELITMPPINGWYAKHNIFVDLAGGGAITASVVNIASNETLDSATGNSTRVPLMVIDEQGVKPQSLQIQLSGAPTSWAYKVFTTWGRVTKRGLGKSLSQRG